MSVFQDQDPRSARTIVCGAGEWFIPQLGRLFRAWEAAMGEKASEPYSPSKFPVLIGPFSMSGFLRGHLFSERGMRT
jgi:hypothetical protein